MRLCLLFGALLVAAPVKAGSSKYSPERTQTALTNLPRSAFGELLTVEPRAEVYLQFPYGFDDHLSTLTFTGNGSTASLAGVFTLQTGAAADSKAEVASVKHLRYIPGRGADIRFTAIFTTGVDNSTQAIGAFDDSVVDGYGFGYNGTAFGVLRSSSSVFEWIPQTSWNIDKMDGTGPSKMTLDQTKFNVYRIVYQWLGAGEISYQIENPATGRFQVVHKIRYAGTETTPSSFNPSLQLVALAQNHANTSNVTLRTQSMAAMSQGPDVKNTIGHSTATVQASVGVTPYPLLTIKSTATFRGFANRVGAEPSLLAVANESTNRSAEFSLILNADSLTNSTFNVIKDAGHAVIDIDMSATAISGGDNIMTIFVGPAESIVIPLGQFAMDLYAGDTLTIVGKMDAGTADLKAAIRWEEKF